MTNIELLRNAKVGDRFRKGNGDILEILEMPEFDHNGLPNPSYGKMLFNGKPKTWENWQVVKWFAETSDPEYGLTPIPAEPVVDLKLAREWKILEAVHVRGGHVYVVSKADNDGFIGCRHYKNSTLYIYAGPSYTDALVACESDMEAAQ